MARIDLLKTFIAQRPNDPFPRYGLALEYKNGGQLAEAERVFAALMDEHPSYTAAYLHAGNTAVSLGRTEAARAIYQRGVEACTKAGDGHALGELQGALAAMPALASGQVVK